MIRKYGGQKARRGSYWDTRRWEIFVVESDGEVLPGSDTHLYLRLNTLEQIIGALAIGGIFVLFIPFVGVVAGAVAFGIFIMSFVVQKLLCNAIRKICAAETWLCDLTHRYFCKSCGKDCDDNITMIVKALFFATFFLLGAAAHKYLM